MSNSQDKDPKSGTGTGNSTKTDKAAAETEQGKAGGPGGTSADPGKQMPPGRKKKEAAASGPASAPDDTKASAGTEKTAQPTTAGKAGPGGSETPKASEAEPGRDKAGPGATQTAKAPETESGRGATQTPKAAQTGSGRGQGAALLVATLAFLLSLGVGGALFYLWQESETVRADQARQLERLSADMASRDERLSRVDAAVGRESGARETLSERVDARLATVERGLTGVQDRTTRQERGWQVAEIKHLQRMASHRLTLMNDPEGARRALQAADTLLAEMGDPRLSPVREIMAGEIQALEDMPRTDVEGLALRLEHLARDLRPLPLRGQAVPDTGVNEMLAGDPVATDAPWWQRALGEVREALAEHISIRRHGEPLRMLPDAETELFLRQLLTLRVEAARVAVLRLDDGQFQRNLESALALLDEHFDPAATGTVRGRLEDLQTVTLRPSAPDISGSFTRLDELEG